MENIFKNENMYMNESEGVILDLDCVIFDDAAAHALREQFIEIVYKYGFISVGDIINIINSSSEIFIKNPSYLSMKYGFIDCNFFKFELDHQPKYPKDVYWKLKITSPAYF